ncbi:MAG: phosphate-selective porin [Paracoccaceae bacterium]
MKRSVPRPLLPLAWIALGQLLLAGGAFAQESGAESDHILRWTLGDGLRAHWGAFEARIRPRFHFDLVDPRFREISEQLGEPFERQIDVRRARLLGDFGFQKGSALESWSLRAQVDFSDSHIDWKDLVASYAGLPALQHGADTRIRAGHFREPFGLEAMTSVSHLPFIERSAASNAFTPGRSRGVQWSEQTDHSLLQLGWFRRADGDVFPNELGEETAVTARGLWQRGREPLAGFELVQVGGSLSLRQPGEDALRFSARPGSQLMNRIVDTGGIDADSAATLGVESLMQWGQSSLVAELFGAHVDANGGEDGSLFTGAHLGFFTFLTKGHAARWNPRRGGIRSARVPDGLHADEPTSGALEAAARLTWVDLDSGDVDGGRSADLEVGLNWYLQPTTRFMLHWIGARIDAPGGSTAFGSAVLARIQLQL